MEQWRVIWLYHDDHNDGRTGTFMEEVYFHNKEEVRQYCMDMCADGCCGLGGQVFKYCHAERRWEYMGEVEGL